METSDPTKPIVPNEIPSSDSAFFKVSVRAWLAIFLVATVCASHFVTVIGTLLDAYLTKNFDKVGSLTTIGEPLYSMSVAALGFYFGQNQAKK